MTQAERRHDRLAVRLSMIIGRLVAGETLDMRKLAAEFGVSVRTLRRDFRERLMYLDLEYRQGRCRLLSGSRQRELAVMTFARQSGVESLFPGLDGHLVSSLLSGPGGVALPYLAGRICTDHHRWWGLYPTGECRPGVPESDPAWQRMQPYGYRPLPAGSACR
ncbi:transcriptional regulator [Salmonella enterica subsp. diarizonae]|nr:transcriptional regulator [Salmonella enterica subsp. diarizonae]